MLPAKTNTNIHFEKFWAVRIAAAAPNQLKSTANEKFWAVRVAAAAPNQLKSTASNCPEFCITNSMIRGYN